MAFMYTRSNGIDLTDHGHYNMIVISALVVVNLLLYYLIRGVLYLIIKFKPILLLFLAFSIWYWIRVHKSWEGWELGIGNSKILNNVGETKIENPNYWELSIRHGLFDVYGFFGTCKNQPMTVSPLLLNDKLKKLKSTNGLTKLGYPRTEKMPNHLKNVTAYEDRFEYIKEGMIDMDDPEVPQSVKDQTEWVLDMTDPDRHILDISVKRNDSRAEELKTLRKDLKEERKAEGKPDLPDYNVLIFYVDNISRAHFHRAFPKFSEWLSQFTPDKEAEFQATEFFRYHTIGRITSKASPGMYYGVNDIYVPNDNQNIGRFYSENGFVTGYVRDEWDYDSQSIGETSPPKDFYSYDHYGSTIIWDPNYDRGGDDFIELDRGHSSYFERWIYSRNVGETMMEYMDQFWTAYPDVPKFLRSSFMQAHELTGEGIYHFDDKILNFFKNFHAKGFLKNTQVMIVSDHGAHDLVIRSPFFPDDSRSLENALATLIHLSPSDTPKENLKFVQENEQRFLSSHEIFATLKSLAYGYKEGSPYMKDFSYFHENLPQNRDWGDVECYEYWGEMIFVNWWLRKDYSKIEARKKANSYFNPLAIVLEGEPLHHKHGKGGREDVERNGHSGFKKNGHKSKNKNGKGHDKKRPGNKGGNHKKPKDNERSRGYDKKPLKVSP